MPVKRKGYRDLRLVAPAVLAWLAASGSLRWIISGGNPAVVVGLVFGALLLSSAAFAFTPKTPRARHAHYPVGSVRALIALALLAVSLAAISAVAHGIQYRDHRAHDACRTKCVLEGEVARNSREVAGSTQTWITHVKLRESSATLLLITPAQVQARVGDKVTVSGRVRPGLSAPMIGSMKPESIQVRRTVTSRSMFRVRLDEALEGFDRDTHGLIAGMSIGDFSKMSPEAKDAMVSTGTSHLTAISGTHLAIVIGTIHALIPGRSRFKIGVVSALVAGLVAVVGPTPSIIRSASMAVIPTWGVMIGRGGQSINSLALVALTWVIIDPWLSVSMGFILSTLSTAGVLIAVSGVKPVKIKLRRPAPIYTLKPLFRLIAKKLGFVIAVPSAATIATAPALLHMTGELALYSVPANIAVSPLVAPATLSSLATAITAQIDPALAAMPGRVAAWCAGWILTFTQKFAGLPHAMLGQPGALILILALDLAALVWIVWKLLPLLVRHWIPSEAIRGIK
ncbi:MAG: ComEC/Rec2 family competence protein [Actinomycetaceae bacterium]|nr:ComEC/Rec2 family competence protein [Actinomycetaceae bacterium]